MVHFSINYLCQKVNTPLTHTDLTETRETEESESALEIHTQRDRQATAKVFDFAVRFIVRGAV